MKKNLFYLAAFILIAATSCTKDFERINTNPSSFLEAQPDAVLPGVFLNTINRFEQNNLSWLWEYGHIVDNLGRYNVGDDGVWNTIYVNVLGNTRQLKKLYDGKAGYTNRMAITDIWECYVYANMVGTYGPVPYSHMGETDKTSIEYDSENDIYTSILTRLKKDAAAITTSGDKFTGDPIFNGDMTKWIKFANSLRLRTALSVQKNLPDLAISNIKELMANEATLLSSDADNVKFTYGTATGSQSLYFRQLVLGTGFIGNGFPYMSDYAFTYFRSYKDPRIDSYFAKAVSPYNITDTLTSTANTLHYIVSYPIPHLGQPKSAAKLPSWDFTSATNPSGFSPFNGANGQQGNFSRPQPALFAADRPFFIMTYAELCFMKAEASIKGYGGAQTAQTYYNAGVSANFAFWGHSPAQAATYLAQDGIKWGTSGKGYNYPYGFINTGIPADNLTKIWIQQWLNYYIDGGFEAWLLQRRTQNLVLPTHTSPGAIAGITTIYQNLPDRFAYPVQAEAVLNPVGYANGVAMLGGPDFYNTRLKIEPDYTSDDWTKKIAFLDQTFVQKWYGQNIEDLTAAGVKYTVLRTY